MADEKTVDELIKELSDLTSEWGYKKFKNDYGHEHEFFGWGKGEKDIRIQMSDAILLIVEILKRAPLVTIRYDDHPLPDISDLEDF